MDLKRISALLLTMTALLMLMGCKKNHGGNNKNSQAPQSVLVDPPPDVTTPIGMVWVKGKTFVQGAKPNDPMAMPREKPGHRVSVDGFFIDVTEVTNAQFGAFVEATGYVTVAERPIDWESMKKELPPGTPKPPDSLLVPGSLIFNKNLDTVASMDQYSQWWTWKTGANWKHPEGPDSNLENKDQFPVVHITREDALAYCKWANRRLPTEAEWESAAQGTNEKNIFTWGNDVIRLYQSANTWQGVFPTKNTPEDGHAFIAPVKSYPANSIGVYDMLGNVWELTNDLFNVDYYKELDTSIVRLNPKGAHKTFDPGNQYQEEWIIKGGSYLCHASYCASYRISARMGISPDSSTDHTGFRTVATVEQLRQK